jgi:hypothetical protein
MSRYAKVASSILARSIFGAWPTMVLWSSAMWESDVNEFSRSAEAKARRETRVGAETSSGLGGSAPACPAASIRCNDDRAPRQLKVSQASPLLTPPPCPTRRPPPPPRRWPSARLGTRTRSRLRSPTTWSGSPPTSACTCSASPAGDTRICSGSPSPLSSSSMPSCTPPASAPAFSAPTGQSGRSVGELGRRDPESTGGAVYVSRMPPMRRSSLWRSS